MRPVGWGSILLLERLFPIVFGYDVAGDGFLVERDTDKPTIPVPIIASVSQDWEGNDGPWSTFTIQIGQKAQLLRVLPSTASTITYVIVSAGCPSDAPPNCADTRGGLFNSNDSLTWIPNSVFPLGLSENQGVDIFGDFGFDTVTLGWQESGGPTVEHAVVAGIGYTHFTWLGGLGLNPRPTNFSTFPDNPQVSFVQALKDEKEIPSVSWAYTAGAPYRLDKMFGSLVLGGYDQARFEIPESTSKTLTFPFSTDVARDLLVGISTISTSSTISSSSTTALLSKGISAFIDSTAPFFYLPVEVYTSFESAFGLTWNSTLELYLINSTHHSTLTKLNPSITITLTPSLLDSKPASRVDITLPYAAFDLNVSWPFTQESTYYFPLRRATNETQYTLGRAFLQEAYLIADYERGNFSVWPCKWDPSVNAPKIVTIHSTNITNSTDDDYYEYSDKSLSPAAIAGIAIGCTITVLALAAGLFFLIRWRRKRRSQQPSELSGDHALGQSPKYFPSKEGSNAELDSTPRHELQSHNIFGVFEAPSNHKAAEVDGEEKPRELPGEDRIFELDASQNAEKNGPNILLEQATAVEPKEGVTLLPSSREHPVWVRWEEVVGGTERGLGTESIRKKEDGKEKENEVEKMTDRIRRQSV